MKSDSQIVLSFMRKLRDIWLTEDDISWGADVSVELLRPILYFFWRRKGYLDRGMEGDGVCWRWRHAAS